MAFTNYDLYHSPPAKLVDWVGFKNYIDIFKLDIWRTTFFGVFGLDNCLDIWCNDITSCIGIFLAILVNQKDLKGKALFRTILILPWAVPSFISILIFSGMFNESFGVN